MKNLLILATMLLTFGFANAQCKIYSSSKSYGGNIVGYIDGSKIYSSSKSYGGNIVGYIDGSKIYSSSKSYGGNIVGYGEGCGIMSLGAAALLLLF